MLQIRMSAPILDILTGGSTTRFGGPGRQYGTAQASAACVHFCRWILWRSARVQVPQKILVVPSHPLSFVAFQWGFPCSSLKAKTFSGGSEDNPEMFGLDTKPPGLKVMSAETLGRINLQEPSWRNQASVGTRMESKSEDMSGYPTA